MKILIAAGSSGGHIFPAIATAFRLKELDSAAEVFFVGSKKGLDAGIFRNEGYPFAALSANKHILSDMVRSFQIIKRFRPDIVVGFGGYVSFPVIAVARLLGIPTMVHEQNLVPGLANRVLSNIAGRIAVSFGGTRDFFLKKDIIVLTGNPIRASLVRLNREKMLERFGLDRWKFTILAMGGSQGAHFINDLILDTLRDMDESQRRRFQVIHLCGLKDFEFMKTGYEKIGVANRIFSFYDRMSEVYSASDLAVSRAGATSISEIMFFALPAILVPYPNPKVHQVENARYMEAKGAAIVIEQGKTAKDYLKNVIMDLSCKIDRLKAMSENSVKYSMPQAARGLAEEILNVARR